ncbi:MAG: GTP-binding protein, partial [Candidatus Helarchaeota archaeon]|nr:GTP-binding protein [Candidatus Helarchaeota archaeon]
MTISDMLNALLKNYITATAVKAAAIVDKDGLIIASQVAGDMNELSIGGVTAAIEKLYDRIKMEFKLGGRFGTTTFEHETGKMIFVNAGPNAILTTLASVVANTETVLPYSYIVAEKIVQILDKRKEIDVTMPKMVTEAMKFSFKVVILGDGGVGKTSLLNRFVEKSFDQDYKSTIGTNIMRVDYKIMEKVTVGFALWDLAGQQFFQKVRQMYLTGCQAALFVYDVTRPDTLYNLKNWKNELLTVGGADVKSLMVGNKADLTDQRKVSFEEGKKVADELGLSYLETSAKTGENVHRAFGAVAFLLIKDK